MKLRTVLITVAVFIGSVIWYANNGDLMVFIGCLVWFGCAAAAVSIAQTRGHSGVWFAIIGGPIGLIMAIALPARKPGSFTTTTNPLSINQPAPETSGLIAQAGPASPGDRV
jgi:hypothetical protein